MDPSQWRELLDSISDAEAEIVDIGDFGYYTPFNGAVEGLDRLPEFLSRWSETENETIYVEAAYSLLDVDHDYEIRFEGGSGRARVRGIITLEGSQTDFEDLLDNVSNHNWRPNKPNFWREVWNYLTPSYF